MRRRQFTASSLVVATGSTGCLALLDIGDDPEEVVRQFFGALDDGDAEAANELLHDDSPMGTYSKGSLDNLAGLDVTVEGTALLKETGDTAEVRADVRRSNGSESVSMETIVELRTEHGAWKIWAFDRADDSDRTEPLRASAIVDTDPEENTITVQFVANNNVEYVEATVDAEGAPGWEDDGRLEEVGETDTFRAGGDGIYEVTVTAYAGDRSKAILEETVEL